MPHRHSPEVRRQQGVDVELVQVACAQNQPEAEMIQGLLEDRGIPSALQALGINGPQLGFGLLVSNPQRVMVRTDQAEDARVLLAETMIEGEGGDWSDTANARHLDDLGGRKPRAYGLGGAYLRIYLWSLGAIAAALGVFLLLRAA